MLPSSLGLLRHSAAISTSVSTAFRASIGHARPCTNTAAVRPLVWQSKSPLHQIRFASTNSSAGFRRNAAQSSLVSQVAGLKSAGPSTARINGWIGTGAATTCLFGPLIWNKVAMMHPGLAPTARVAHCAAATKTAPYDFEKEFDTKEPWINSKELTFGMAMGLCSGYLVKKLGKMAMLVVGLGFVSLQLLANQGYITVNWAKIERKFKSKFDLDQDGQVTLNDAKHGFRGLLELLTRNFQFKSTFAGGFVLGFRYG
ncbi:hypothetical protein EMPS_00194 [Entomortierella parvispora]|uniref:FUN14 family-domain-containing protein n=1 Tax=Entomortierella parvispora TaxID=205924 RepID=A0A9P3GZM0_9FUNG|nr:hypothetical protein EMPS_00194 [Entomortierella parvispora]